MRNNQAHQDETDYFQRRYEELGRPPLGSWGNIAEKYWRQNLPGLYRGLKQRNVLLAALVLAQENAADRYVQLIEQGVHPEAARELAMKEFLYLDPEQPEENLSQEESLNPIGDLANEQGASSAVMNWLGKMKG